MNSLTELKKIIQSINQNITNGEIDIFQKQFSQLAPQYDKSPTVTSYLKMMRSLGKYLGLRRDDTHADLIPTLHSIIKQLDRLISNPDLEKEEVDRNLFIEIQKFKTLQNEIVSKPTINNNDMNDLKAAILTIDWEIFDTTLQDFEKVITNFLPKLVNYKIHHTFVKIIHSTGRYIGNKKANAHKDSILFLHSVFENFEQVVQTTNMTSKDKKKVLEGAINRFYKFKRKISREKRKNRPINNVHDDESIQPALAHIRKTSMHDPIDDVIPLTTPPHESKEVLTREKPDSVTIACIDK